MSKNVECVSIEEARVSYVDITGTSAPRSLNLNLLNRAICWHKQCICHNVPMRHKNIHVSAKPALIKSITVGPPPGSLLLKEWQGTVHEVRRTTEDQYVYNGKKFSSLTAVASFITGCKRPGPRFFGLADQIEGHRR
ncbi:DUF2924 domain-containing protein [Mesorhizobium koreense]|uniref:DUF2924 domain-containing protein n=1 Tax=Mesorhizobium koreense TaxID=3074855 RepID=UPI0035303B7E